MDFNVLIIGLLQYLSLVILLTFHEFGHAWMASKCGDDTAKDQGRCSLNPLVHIDPVGTVIMPLLMIFLSLNGSGLSRFMIGWAKPVPVNPSNLRNPKLDDILISMAGPWMNLLLAVVLVGLARICEKADACQTYELGRIFTSKCWSEPVALLFQPHPGASARRFTRHANSCRHEP